MVSIHTEVEVSGFWKKEHGNESSVPGKPRSLTVMVTFKMSFKACA